MSRGDERPEIEVTTIDPRRWRETGHMLADAFQDDPVWMWVAPNESLRQTHMGAMFAEVIRARVLSGLAYSTASLEGAAVWAEPDNWKMTAWQNVRSCWPSLRTLGLSNLRSGLSMLTKIERAHPTEPHWYLEFLAARVDLRGKGYGSALIKPMLDRCDFEAMPAYLESSKFENIPFYNRFGFEVIEELTFGGDAPSMWTMWREPR